MRMRIHHGAAQIGGNCIELECSGKTLLLDLGLPLEQGVTPALPPVTGLGEGGHTDLLGVVLSHPHLDHYGLLSLAHPSIPVWLGDGAQRLLAAAAPFMRDGVLPQKVNSYRSSETFSIGPFQITPYLMDHSAYDAHGLLIEADGKRLFYTGDFRGHGRKAAMFERFLRNPPGNIDLLLMEGTTLGRSEPFPTEGELEDQLCDAMRDTQGIVLACFAGQNIDRFVTFLRASLAAGRTFIADAYLANLIDGLGRASLPTMSDHPGIRMFLPRTQKRMIIANRRFDLIERYRARRILGGEITANPSRFTMLFRTSMMGDLTNHALIGGTLIWSLWPGYLARDRVDLRQWAEQTRLGFRIMHTSGHADMGDLIRMANGLAPRRLVPIHTHHPDQYGELYTHVTPMANGLWFDV